MKTIETKIVKHIKKIKPSKGASTRTTGLACIPTGGD